MEHSPSGSFLLSADFGTLFVLLATVVGFVLPMLWVYPPLPPRPSDFLNETHSKLGLGEKCRRTGGSTSDDVDADGKNTTAACIASLWAYPVESCRGIAVARSRVLPTGFAFDRLFAFAQLKGSFPAAAGASVTATQQETQEGQEDGGDGHEDETWDFITQRQFPRMASLEVELWQPDLAKAQRARAGMRASYRAEREASMGESFVVVRFPWAEAGAAGIWALLGAKMLRGWRAEPEMELVLPVTASATESDYEDGRRDSRKDGKPETSIYPHANVRIWRHVVRAVDLSAELPPELQLYLGVSNRLGVFRINPACCRRPFRDAAPKEVIGYQPVTAFQDATPVHLLNRSSVRSLETVVETDKNLLHLDEQSFRANIIVSGVLAYDEDSWHAISFRPAALPSNQQVAKFQVSCPTVRKLPNVDPDTGERRPQEPDRAGRTFRDADKGVPESGCLGVQLTPIFERPDQPELMELTLEVGMALDVLERGKHEFLKT